MTGHRTRSRSVTPVSAPQARIRLPWLSGPSGTITRSLGEYPSMFPGTVNSRAHPRPPTQARGTPSACPAGILSRSRVKRSRPSAHSGFRRSPVNVPPTKPPTSFRSSCLAFGSARYCSRVSVPRDGSFQFFGKFGPHDLAPRPVVDFGLPAVLICIFPVISQVSPPNPSYSNRFQIQRLLAPAPAPMGSALPLSHRSLPPSFPLGHQ